MKILAFSQQYCTRGNTMTIVIAYRHLCIPQYLLPVTIGNIISRLSVSASKLLKDIWKLLIAIHIAGSNIEPHDTLWPVAKRLLINDVCVIYYFIIFNNIMIRNMNYYYNYSNNTWIMGLITIISIIILMSASQHTMLHQLIELLNV